MENLLIAGLDKLMIQEYIQSNHLMAYETLIIDEMILAILSKDVEKNNWFNRFGDSLRKVAMNVNAYRRGLDFGFTDIFFDNYGWLARAKFLEIETLCFGLSDRYGTYSEIRLGKGNNGVWTYALSYCYGTAGGGSSVSVFDPLFACRADAIEAGLKELKSLMEAKVGNTDTCNYKQPVILATLKAIADYRYAVVQLSLF